MEKEIIPHQDPEAPKEWVLSWEVRDIQERKMTAEPYNKEFLRIEAEEMLKKLKVHKFHSAKTGNTEKIYYEPEDKDMLVVTLTKEGSNESRVIVFKDPDQIKGIKKSIEKGKAT